MVIRGRMHNGVVVLESDALVPEGTEVSVLLPLALETVGEDPLDANRQRVLAIMDRIAALPIEGDDKPFSGADHDVLLYGTP